MEEHITVRRDIWENMQSALAKAVHYITVPEATPLGVLGRVEASEDAPNLSAVAQEPRRFTPAPAADAEAGPWQTWEAVPECVKYRSSNSRSGAVWFNQDYNRYAVTPDGERYISGIEDDQMNTNLAPFVAAEDTTLEGLSEFAQPIPYLLTPRTFERGDIIPDDVKMLKLDSGETKSFQYVNRKGNGNFGYLHALNGWGEPDTSKGMWEWSDFPAVEVVEKVLFTLDETVVHLRHHGIRTDAVRLADYLKNSISWTDFYGKPRGCASNYVVDVSDDFADSDVAFTSAGLSVLVSTMRKAAA